MNFYYLISTLPINILVIKTHQALLFTVTKVLGFFTFFVKENFSLLNLVYYIVSNLMVCK